MRTYASTMLEAAVYKPVAYQVIVATLFCVFVIRFFFSSVSLSSYSYLFSFSFSYFPISSLSLFSRTFYHGSFWPLDVVFDPMISTRHQT